MRALWLCWFCAVTVFPLVSCCGLSGSLGTTLVLVLSLVRAHRPDDVAPCFTTHTSSPSPESIAHSVYDMSAPDGWGAWPPLPLGWCAHVFNLALISGNHAGCPCGSVPEKWPRDQDSSLQPWSRFKGLRPPTRGLSPSLCVEFCLCSCSGRVPNGVTNGLGQLWKRPGAPSRGPRLIPPTLALPRGPQPTFLIVH
jgi:hypothetical protein